ncbi:MAG: peptidoglycan DD-metalloendopeptidase family protein [Helicobacteraceae bacterium]|nr:peptidoglycan DD-metalloendopeptidase family protein [Helicobacteraceae bacterium]
MNERFTITIHDTSGFRQFNLHQIVKKIGFYVALFLVLIFAIGATVIIYLDNSLEELNTKRDSLVQENKTLQTSVNSIENTLNSKKEELLEVSDKLDDIEELIGLTPAKEVALKERVDTAKLTSSQIGSMLRNIPNGSPVAFKGITSKRGMRVHPTLKRKEFHRGVDMRAKMKTRVYAPADGVVEYSGKHKSSGFGNLVIIRHNYGFKTLYGHLNKVVHKSGTFVNKGDLIAYTGNSGMSSGPHLHYEVRFAEHTIDPQQFIDWDLKNYKNIFKEKGVPWQSLVTAMTQK